MNRVSASIAHAFQSTALRFSVSRLTTFWSITSRWTTSKHSSNLDRPWTLSASLSSLDFGFSESPHTLDHGLPVNLWVHSISASKCISKLARFRPASESLNLVDLGLQVHLQPRSIPDSKCISEFTWSRSSSASPESLHRRLEIHLQGASAGVRWYRGNRCGQSDWEYLFGRCWSR